MFCPCWLRTAVTAIKLKKQPPTSLPGFSQATVQHCMKPWQGECFYLIEVKLTSDFMSCIGRFQAKEKNSHSLGLFRVNYGLLKIFVDQQWLWAFWKQKNIEIWVKPEKKYCRIFLSSRQIFFEFSVQPKWAYAIQVLKRVWTWSFK